MDEPQIEGRFTDGRSARRHQVAVAAGDAGLTLTAGTGERWEFAYIGIQRLPQMSRGDDPVLCFADMPDARLVLTSGETLSPFIDVLRNRCPAFDDLIRPSRAARRSIALWIVGGMAGIAAAYFGLPLAAAALAPLTPPTWEAKLGRQSEATMKTLFQTTSCDAEPPAPLTNLVTRLTDAAHLPSTPKITVVGTKLVNAFALPGNHILVTTGLIDELASGDELAGIAGHEIGHLKYHDSTAALITQTGWSALATMFFGLSSQGQMSTMLLTMSYSRELEARADDTSLVILRTAGLDSGGYERAMRRFAEKHKDNLGILSSHPPSLERAEHIAAAGPKGESAMSAEDWQAIKAYASACEPKAETKP